MSDSFTDMQASTLFSDMPAGALMRRLGDRGARGQDISAEAKELYFRASEFDRRVKEERRAYWENDDLVELVARALYERAMSERRFTAEQRKAIKDWFGAEYVPPLVDGCRETDWRDLWRDAAKRALGHMDDCDYEFCAICEDYREDASDGIA